MTVLVTGNICPLCGSYLQPIGGISHKDTIHCVNEEPPRGLYAWVAKCLIIIVGIFMGIVAGFGACFYWFIINTGVTLGPNGNQPFLLATIAIFAVAFILVVWAWFQAFGIWPFKER